MSRSTDELLGRAQALLAGPGRRLLGICGAPGAGKSALAAKLVDGIGPQAVVVPMDGFHLHDDELARLGLSDRKGAPQTFDVDGYVELLRRIAAGTGRTVYAPSFDRDRELSLAAAIPVRPGHRLVVTEGNYLLLDAPGWRDLRGVLDECWFLQGDDELRVRRLVARHVSHGRSPDAAKAWVARSDQVNARLVAPSAVWADLVVDAW